MDILCFGIIVVDHRRKCSKNQDTSIPLQIVDKAVDLYVGGIPIVAMATTKMGLKTGLMGNVGRDIGGYGLKNYLKDVIGIDVEGVKIIDAPTSSSFIQLTQNERYIEHTPGTSTELLPTDKELAFVADKKIKLMVIGYSGLLPKLDANNGTNMAVWIQNVQKTGALVALDTHTVPPYKMLEKPVCVADIFICNREEGEGITGLKGSSPERILSEIWYKFLPRNPQCYRLLGLTIRDGLQLAYGNKDISVNKWISNSYYGTFTPTDLTGAGDSLRAGIYAYITRHLEDFKSGLLNILTTAKYGLYVSSQYLNKGVDNLPLFEEIASNLVWRK